MKKPACLIFDLFGTLVEYDPVRTNLSYEKSFRSSGFTCTYEDYIEAWEHSFREREAASAASGAEFHMFEVANGVLAALGATGPDVDELTRDYLRDWRQGVQPIPGAGGLLRRLARHYRLALVSNTHYSPMVHEILEEIGITSVMDVVVTSVDVGVPKPARQIFDAALERLAVSASDAVYVGDQFEADYLGATRMGMDCFLFGSHARVPRDRQLRSILDLPIHFDT